MPCGGFAQCTPLPGAPPRRRREKASIPWSAGRSAFSAGSRRFSFAVLYIVRGRLAALRSGERPNGVLRRKHTNMLACISKAFFRIFYECYSFQQDFLAMFSQVHEGAKLAHPTNLPVARASDARPYNLDGDKHCGQIGERQMRAIAWPATLPWPAPPGLLQPTPNL